MIEQGLFAYLASVPDVIAIVGGHRPRIYPMVIPQHEVGEPTELACLVYTLISSTPDVTFCGTNRHQTTLIQIDSYAKTYLAATELAIAVRTALVDYGGMMGDVHVANVQLQNELSLLDPEPGLYRKSQSYTIWHTE